MPKAPPSCPEILDQDHKLWSNAERSSIYTYGVSPINSLLTTRKNVPTFGRMSSELSHQISLLKGHHTSAEIVKGADVSKETFRKIERGEPVKLSTLRKIANFLKATDAQWGKLVEAWIKLGVGPEEARHLRFHYHSQELRDDASDSEQIAQLAKQLNPTERKQIILAITRPEVRRSLAAINSLYDNVRQKGRRSS
jgi:transcriptional regulator with XRE-family HTH domain